MSAAGLQTDAVRTAGHGSRGLATVADRAAALVVVVGVVAVLAGWAAWGVPSGADWSAMAGLVAGAQVSEDLTCITAGLLVQRGEIGPVVGVTGCVVGILLGDLGLYALGYWFGPPLLGWGPVRRRLEGRVEAARSLLERNLVGAVVVSRFTPGLRLPTYVLAGSLRVSPGRFSLWLAAGAMVWAPLLVAGSALVGEGLASVVDRWRWAGWWVVGASAVGLWAGLGLARRWADPAARRAAVLRLRRMAHHEFWPAWMLYGPLVVVLAALWLRHRSLLAPLACNPGIDRFGGLVGESKAAILSGLKSEFVLRFVLLEPVSLEQRLALLEAWRAGQGIGWPLVLKPDAGQRGAGVRLIHDAEQARVYLAGTKVAVLAQEYHPGPYEAGVFYVRHPEAAAGQILSLTDKVFPHVVGDGQRSVGELIASDARLRLQEGVFARRLGGQGLGRVPLAGERVRLAVAGNHCQGTLFRDGSGMITAALEARLDAIARGFAGVYFGRFDIRYADPAAFARGEGLGIVELNGLTSESTNLYDPSWSVLQAWTMLSRQWAWAFRIGAANRRLGVAVPGLLELIRHVRAFERLRAGSGIDDLSD